MRTGRPDAGFTLLDTMMAMTVMTLVMAVFTSSMLSMYRASDAIEARSTAQTQINIAMQRLDHQIRYAIGIGLPYTVGPDQYVDFLTVENGGRRCVQLRVRNGMLAQRSWTHRADPIDLTGWNQLADGVTNTTVFGYVAPTPAIDHQRLVATIAAGATGAKEANTMTFTALNTDRTSGNDYCAAARSL